jgi:hypothetical protein
MSGVVARLRGLPSGAPLSSHGPRRDELSCGYVENGVVMRSRYRIRHEDGLANAAEMPRVARASRAICSFAERTIDGIRNRSMNHQTKTPPPVNQMVFLGVLATPAKGQSVAIAWRTLSDLCHYRPYQITPLATEIDNAITLAEHAVASLRTM